MGGRDTCSWGEEEIKCEWRRFVVMAKSQRERWREASNKQNIINDSIVFLNQKACLARRITGNDSYEHNLSP